MWFVCNRKILLGWRLGIAGVTSLEVAVIFGAFIVLMFGTIDLSRYFFTQQALTTLVNSAARQGLADPGFGQCDGPPSSWTAIPNITPLIDSNQVSICVTQPNFSTGVQVLTVTGTYNFMSITPGLDALIGTMSETVTYQY